MQKAHTFILVFLLSFCSIWQAWSMTYSGRVLDAKGQPIPYTTVYPEHQPELGTASNNSGFFSFEADLPENEPIVVSFIGYEKKIVYAGDLLSTTPRPIFLKEQPIQLEETVVKAKTKRSRSKRKQLADLLHKVYVQMERDFSSQPALYTIVSDVAMQNDSSTWGMEQMIANIVTLPETAHDGKDSIQFQGLFCKRFFDAQKRKEADSIFADHTLERLEKEAKMPNHAPKNLMRRAANSIDSGVVVHRAIFGISDIRFDFQENMEDLKHWKISNEGEQEMVLTYTQKISKYLGFFKMIYKRHYIVDAKTYSVRRFSEHAEVRVTIPFGYKLNQDQLQLLNLLNMDQQHIQKFRIRKLRASADLNTIYQRKDQHLYVLEKNMQVDAHFVGSRKAEVPVLLKATQRITNLQTQDVRPLRKNQITRRLKRQIVEIY